MSERRDDLQALLQLAREAERPSDEGMAEARDAAWDAWAATVRRRRRSRRALAVAATVLLAGALVLLLGPDSGWLAEPAGPLAQLEVVRGNVEVRAEGEAAEGGPERVRPRSPSEWRRETELDVPLRAGTVLETAPGGRAALRLQSGSRIRLDATSRLRLAGVGRVDLERGALSFESARLVAGADASPGTLQDIVEVSTPLGVIVNRGTSYEARLEGDALVVRVRSGSVAVRPLRGQAVTVVAGQVARVRRGGGVALELLAPAEASSAWTRSLVVPFAIDGRSLGDFLAWVEREGGFETRLGAGVEAQLLQSRLRGDLVWTLPEEALEPTLALLGLRASYGDGIIVVER